MEAQAVLVLAPGAARCASPANPVYGIDTPDKSTNPVRHYASAMPAGALPADQKMKPNVPLWSTDRNIKGSGNRVIPVWGVIHRCGEAHRCVAASLLRAHLVTWIWARGGA